MQSVIIILTPDKIAIDDVLNYFCLNTANGNIRGQLLGSHAGRINAWKGWSIDYILSTLTLPIPSNCLVDPYHAAFAFVDLNIVLSNLLLNFQLNPK